ncbi:MAG: hypothetical protein LBP59_06590 [Planctomycetaceae bacterium]|nr:hypothetical protein [Planctomycetaceae bacterium]
MQARRPRSCGAGVPPANRSNTGEMPAILLIIFWVSLKIHFFAKKVGGVSPLCLFFVPQYVQNNY